MEKKFFMVGTGILVLIIVAAAVALVILRRPPQYNGSVIDPPAPAHDFTLADQQGQLVSLSQFRGKYVLLYFGFTHCTQECPATMAVLAKARSLLGNQADKVQILFVSTDPARDTPAAISTFVNRFDASIIGVTGTQAQLQPVWADYGVTVLDNGETHSSFVYLINPNGDMIMTYPYPSTAEGVSSDLKQLFRKG